MKTPTTQADRLRKARERAGYASAADAARALGVAEAGYRHHENGTNGLSRVGDRYAQFFHVRYEWLMTGDGDMLDNSAVPVVGNVGAGSAVDWRDNEVAQTGQIVAMPDGADAIAFVVKGDSQIPRFYAGEIVLAERRQRNPEDLIGQYAIVQTGDGRTLIKIVRAHGPDKYRLESHNAETEEDVSLKFGHRYLGSLARVNSSMPGARPRSPPSTPAQSARKVL